MNTVTETLRPQLLSIWFRWFHHSSVGLHSRLFGNGVKKLLLAIFFVTFGLNPFVFAEGASVSEKAPDFTLTDTNGNEHSLSSYQGKFVVLEWNNPDCPFVKKHYGSGNMQSLQGDYTSKGVVWLTINSSAAGKQGGYSAAEMNEMMKKNGAKQTAVLLDPAGEVGKKYGAKTTPHMFVINPEGVLIYNGAID
ncbi:MAG: redoxin domain-containing protein, partial [Candidatus Omnitrophica bacterium]|nr:redoxin domain-containing protein [Candidatus Omnitrophota bacterium]